MTRFGVSSEPKEKNCTLEMKAKGAGDVWTWTAICADSKLILCWFVGNRDAGCAYHFMHDLAERLANRVQLTTDGHRAYLSAVEDAFGANIDLGLWNFVTCAILLLWRRLLSFTKGAEKLHLAQPSLTRQIKDLEEELDVLLLNRTKRQVSLTDGGRSFLIDAKRLLYLAREMVESVQRLKSGEVSALIASDVVI